MFWARVFGLESIWSLPSRSRHLTYLQGLVGADSPEEKLFRARLNGFPTVLQKGLVDPSEAWSAVRFEQRLFLEAGSVSLAGSDIQSPICLCN